MKTFKELRHELNEAKGGKSPLLKFLDNYMTNDHYVHFTDMKVARSAKNPSYNSTPAAIYAWQMNAYKKGVLEKIQLSIKTYKSDKAKGSVRLNPVTQKSVVQDGKFNTIITSVFPYGGRRDNAVIVRAKPKLKWLRVRRMNKKEAQRLLDISIEHMDKQYKPLVGWLTPSNMVALFRVVDAGDSMEFLWDKYQRDNKKSPDEGMKEVFSNLYYDLRRPRDRWNNATGIGDAKRKESIAAYVMFERFVVRNSGIFEASKILGKLGYDAIRDDTNPEGDEMGTIFSVEKSQVGFLGKWAFKDVVSFKTTDLNKIHIDELPKIEKRMKALGYPV